jgi:hypothetical protein
LDSCRIINYTVRVASVLLTRLSWDNPQAHHNIGIKMEKAMRWAGCRLAVSGTRTPTIGIKSQDPNRNQMKSWTERVHQRWKEQEFNLLGKAPAPAPCKQA